MSAQAEAENKRGTRIDKLVIDLENGRVEVSGWSMDHSDTRQSVPARLGDGSNPQEQQPPAHQPDGTALHASAPDSGDAAAPAATGDATQPTDTGDESQAETGDVPVTDAEGALASGEAVPAGDDEADGSGDVLAGSEMAGSTSAEQVATANISDAAAVDAPKADAPAEAHSPAGDAVVASHVTPAPPPVDIQAVAITNRKTARCGDAVLLSGEASYSGAAPISEYQWDFDGDGAFDDAFGAAVEHTLVALPSSDGVYRPVPIGLRIIDTAGNTATTKVEVVPGPSTENRPPSVLITPRFTYVDRNGQEDVIIDASGTSDPDGQCDRLRYQWTCESAGNGVCRTDTLELTGPVLRIPWQTMETDTTYFWKLTVTDLAGAQSFGSAVIESVSRIAPPQPTIEVRGKVHDDGLRANCIYRAETNEPIWCAD